MPSQTSRPNIVLICVDQWRGDCLSIDNHHTVQTPYLDQWAMDGARFSHAYAATPSCVPARASLMTGLRPATHGRVGYADGVAWPYTVTMAGEFTRGGYQTQAIGKMHVFPERAHLGFENVQLHDGFLHFARSQHPDLRAIDDYVPWLRERSGDPDADYFDNGLNCNSYVARPWDKAEALHPTNWVMTRGIEFLRRRDTTRPFFLFLSLHRPHPPLDPPAWAFEQYLHQPMPDPPRGDWIETFAHLAPHGQRDRAADPSIGDFSPTMLQRARAGYYGHLSHIDTQINRFAESLTEKGLARDTVLCFVSDHGEMLGDHRFFRKTLPYEGSARVPLIFRAPSLQLRAGAQCDQVAELRDILPTLLDCAGLQIPESIEGRSLLPLMRGQNCAWRKYLHGEHPALGSSAHFITDGKTKYIWISGDGTEQFFDLENDPDELLNLINAPAMSARIAAARQQLIASQPHAPKVSCKTKNW